MRHVPTTATALIALSILFTAVNLPATAQPQEETVRRTTQWEHLALPFQGADVTGQPALSGQIVKLGAEGWQLVSVSTVVQDGTTVKHVMYFKRPKH